MVKQIRQYYCENCEKVVDPYLRGRATYICNKCGMDISVSVAFQKDAIYDDYLLPNTTKDG